MPLYSVDNELEQLANGLIKAHHPSLEAVRIAYVFRDQAPVSNGKTVAGMTYRCDDRNFALHHFDFVIEIAKDVWQDATNDFRRALMDHELCHPRLVLDEDGRPIRDEKTGRLKVGINKHDVEEFDAILERHGAYHSDLRKFLSAWARRKESKKSAESTSAPLDAE